MVHVLIPETLEDWRTAALNLYFKVSGHRCVRCSAPVKIEDAALEIMFEEYLLVHKDMCMSLTKVIEKPKGEKIE